MTKCLYCDYDVLEERSKHYVTFQNGGTEREELLCDECYQEWLQGIKE